MTTSQAIKTALEILQEYRVSADLIVTASDYGTHREMCRGKAVKFMQLLAPHMPEIAKAFEETVKADDADSKVAEGNVVFWFKSDYGLNYIFKGRVKEIRDDGRADISNVEQKEPGGGWQKIGTVYGMRVSDLFPAIDLA